jgi:hypothetical protein
MFTQDEDKHTWKQHHLLTAGRRRYLFTKGIQDVSTLPDEAMPIDIIQESPTMYITNMPTPLYRPLRPKRIGTFAELLDSKKKETFFKDICLTMEESDIRDKFRQQAIIDTATDGGFDQLPGIISYGWVVAVNEMVIAKGKGPAEAHPVIAEAYRGEAYGLAAAATFIREMIDYLSIQPKRHRWFFHIDNKALIKRMESYGLEKITARWMHLPDIDITNHAHETTKNLEPQFRHIKSHQDDQKTSSSTISFPARLNIMADALAKQQRCTMNKPEIKVSTNHVHLKIGDIFITRDSQRWLMETSGKIPIQKYYQDKYGWKKQTFDLIDWELQWQVLNSYDLNDQKRILKFVHGWLPTNSRLHRERQSTSPRCPMCHYIQEDEIHLFQCLHPMQKERIKEIQKFLKQESDINKEIQNLIAEAVIESITTTGPDHDGNRQCKFLQDQAEIGWQQVLRGRIARAITTLPSNKQDPESGGMTQTRWPRNMLRTIWDTFLILWNQ